MNPADLTQLEFSEEKAVIKLLPDSDREFLEQKLKEYHARYTRQREKHSFRHPLHPGFADSVYKIALLWMLLNIPGMEINTWQWSIRLAKQDYMHVEEFQNACGVIADYVATGGKNVYR